MKSVTSNRPLRELVAEAKAEVMEEIEDNREEGEEDDSLELTAAAVNLLTLFYSNTHKDIWLLSKNQFCDYIALRDIILKSQFSNSSD